LFIAKAYKLYQTHILSISYKWRNWKSYFYCFQCRFINRFFIACYPARLSTL